MSTHPRNTKKIYLVNRDYQIKYAKMAVLVGFVSTILTVFLVLMPLFYFRIIRFPDFLPPPFLGAIALAAVINFILVAAFGIVVTHRVAGPMFSLVRQLRRIQSGNFKAYLKVRDTDDFKYVVRNFNELVNYLVLISREDQAKLGQLIQTLRTGTSSSDKEKHLIEALSLSEELKARIEARLAEGPEAISEHGEKEGAASPS